MDSVTPVATTARRAAAPSSPRWTHTHLERLVPRDNRFEVTCPDTKGLQLRVEPNGRKIFLFRYRWKGKPTRLTLGEFGPPPRMGLADARTVVHTERVRVRDGINPAAARPSSKPVRAAIRAALEATPEEASALTPVRTGKAADPNSVATLVDRFVRLHARPNLRHPEDVARLLEKELVEHLGDRDCRSISRRELADRLDEIVGRGSRVMANKSAAAFGRLYRFAIEKGIVEASPAAYLGRPGGKEKPRSRALSDDELTILFANLDTVYRSERVKLALRVLLYTGQRRGELFAAEWRDVDLESNVWTIRGEISKTGEKSFVPLTDPAVAAFEQLKKLARGARFVLPSEDGKSAGDPKPLTRAVARSLKTWREKGIKEGFGPHDLRRTLRTGLAKLRIEPHVAERVIGHKQRGIVAVYDVHSYADEKRAALEKWAAHLDALVRQAGAQ
jgi:integrase